MLSSMSKYTNNIDILIALISHLGTTKFLSRTPKKLAKSLGLSHKDVTAALENFPNIFRKSIDRHVKGEYWYTLHLRYGLRGQLNSDDEDVERDPLSDAQMGLLFDFVSQMYNAEQQRRIQARATIVPIVCAIITSAALIYIAFFQQPIPNACCGVYTVFT